jgi:hypothetical protein
MAEHPAAQRKDFQELLAKVVEMTPHLEQKIADLLIHRPDLWRYEVDEHGMERVASYQLGKIVAIVMVDWLCWAYDMPEKGFMHEDRWQDLNSP